MHILRERLSSKAARGQLQLWTQSTLADYADKQVSSQELPPCLDSIFPGRTNQVLVEPESGAVAVQWGSGFSHYGVWISVDSAEPPFDMFVEYYEFDDGVTVFVSE